MECKLLLVQLLLAGAAVATPQLFGRDALQQQQQQPLRPLQQLRPLQPAQSQFQPLAVQRPSPSGFRSQPQQQQTFAEGTQTFAEGTQTFQQINTRAQAASQPARASTLVRTAAPVNTRLFDDSAAFQQRRPAVPAVRTFSPAPAPAPAQLPEAAFAPVEQHDAQVFSRPPPPAPAAPPTLPPSPKVNVNADGQRFRLQSTQTTQQDFRRPQLQQDFQSFPQEASRFQQQQDTPRFQQQDASRFQQQDASRFQSQPQTSRFQQQDDFRSQQQKDTSRFQQQDASRFQQQDASRFQQPEPQRFQQESQGFRQQDFVPQQESRGPVLRAQQEPSSQDGLGFQSQQDTPRISVPQVSRGRSQTRRPTTPASDALASPAPLRTNPIRVAAAATAAVPQAGSTDPQEDELFREQAENAHYSFASVVDDKLTDNSQVRQETRDGLNLSGLYSYSDGYFKRTVHYEADENGYRVTKEEVEPIGDGPVPDPTGSAEVQAQISGTDFRYRITADDIREGKDHDRVPSQQQQRFRQDDRF